MGSGHTSIPRDGFYKVGQTDLLMLETADAFEKCFHMAALASSFKRMFWKEIFKKQTKPKWILETQSNTPVSIPLVYKSKARAFNSNSVQFRIFVDRHVRKKIVPVCSLRGRHASAPSARTDGMVGRMH